MTNNTNILTLVFMIMVGIMAILAIILVILLIQSKIKETKSKSKQNENLYKEEKSKPINNKQYTVESVFDFMDFDKIEDNMIVQKKGSKYIMVVECQGVNYDLMSKQEKISVEEGFVQFLNSIAGPIQLYIQTRTINLENSVNRYKDKLAEIEISYNKQKMRYDEISKQPNINKEELKMAKYELVKQRNLYEYGKDIIYNTERMSLNKNILNKKYYIIVSYYPADLGQNNLDKEEIKDLAFSELYTKSQSLIRTLFTTGVTGKVLSSTELLDLLYVCYNRDDAEVYGIDKAMKARYDELYSTAPDYIDKKMELLDDEIDKKAYQKAKEKLNEVLSEKEKEYQEKVETVDDIIDNLAKLIIDENIDNFGEENAEKAKEKITKEKERRENEVNGKEKTKRTRRVSATK